MENVDNPYEGVSPIAYAELERTLGAYMAALNRGDVGPEIKWHIQRIVFTDDEFAELLENLLQSPYSKTRRVLEEFLRGQH